MSLLLMTPGPTRVPGRVLAAGAAPMIHHRTAEFSELLGSTIVRLKKLFGTKGDVLPVHSTGRGALEATIVNLLSPGDELVACCNGVFGEMWAEISEKFGVTVHRICREWDAPCDALEVEEALDRNPRVRGLLVAHSETATGALTDIASLSRAARRAGALVMVDAVSSFGGTPFCFEEWDVDVAVAASQKCLMSSPGLSFVALSDRAWDLQKRARLPRSYFDFPAIRRTLSQAKPETPGTTPVHVVAQVHAALEMIEEEGVDRVYARHIEMSRLAREGLGNLGMPLQCRNLKRYSPTVTAIRVPERLGPNAIRERLRARDILVARALGEYDSTCLRIGHMGDIKPEDVQRTIDALAEIVADAK